MSTAGSAFIQRLYHGTTVNSIVCRECGNVSQRQVVHVSMAHWLCSLWYLFSFWIQFNCFSNSRWTACMDGQLMTNLLLSAAGFRKTSWTWRYAFVACQAWRRHSGACLWRRNCLRAIIYTAAQSVTGWSLLPRSASGMDTATLIHRVLIMTFFLLPVLVLFICSLPS